MPPLQADVTAIQRAYADTIRQKNSDGLLALYDPAARVFDTWATWSYESQAQREPSIREWLTSLAAGEWVKVTFDDVKTIVSGEMTCLTAFVTYAAIDPGNKVLRSMQNRLTWVLARRGDALRIIHEHTSVPVGDELKAMLKRSPASD